MSAERLIRLPPPPTELELLRRFSLTPSEYRRIFTEHDAGDEDPSARRYARFVCSIQPDRIYRLDPNHFGWHEWERR